MRRSVRFSFDTAREVPKPERVRPILKWTTRLETREEAIQRVLHEREEETKRLLDILGAGAVLQKVDAK